MIKIRVFCQNGATTNMLVAKMKKYAEVKGYASDIQAFPYATIGENASDADVILLAPQVRFKAEGLEKEYPDKKVMVVETTDYGMMAGDKVLEKIITQLERKE